MLCRTHVDRKAHLAKYHGSSEEPYEENDGFGHLNLPETRLVEMDDWQPPEVREPTSDELHKVCLLMASAEMPELGLDSAAPELAVPIAYVEAHFATVRKCEVAVKYKVRKTEGKASFLLTALLSPDLTPTSAYAKAHSHQAEKVQKRREGVV
jgi:hypothetical protein